VTAFVTAGGGFLLAVLWFDLMHDVLVLRRGGGPVPEQQLATIAGYYRRVTTEARPMNRLIALVMLGALAAVALQVAGDDAPNWVAGATLALTASAVGLAGARTVPSAVRLGQRADPIEVQGRLARSILRDHLVCLACVVAALVLQLGFAR
jgi:hypothetical protein